MKTMTFGSRYSEGFRLEFLWDLKKLCYLGHVVARRRCRDLAEGGSFKAWQDVCRLALDVFCLQDSVSDEVSALPLMVAMEGRHASPHEIDFLVRITLEASKEALAREEPTGAFATIARLNRLMFLAGMLQGLSLHSRVDGLLATREEVYEAIPCLKSLHRHTVPWKLDDFAAQRAAARSVFSCAEELYAKVPQGLLQKAEEVAWLSDDGFDSALWDMDDEEIISLVRDV